MREIKIGMVKIRATEAEISSPFFPKVKDSKALVSYIPYNATG